MVFFLEFQIIRSTFTPVFFIEISFVLLPQKFFSNDHGMSVAHEGYPVYKLTLPIDPVTKVCGVCGILQVRLHFGS